MVGVTRLERATAFAPSRSLTEHSTKLNYAPIFEIIKHYLVCILINYLFTVVLLQNISPGFDNLVGRPLPNLSYSIYW